MSEQTCSADPRPYQMRKRAEQVEQTRQRIIDATVELHTTVGPADTTISGIAEHAGVTRLTVYRHFPDLDSLYAACTHRWTSQHPGPDPAAWLRISDHDERVRRALRELYGWYREHVDDLYPLYRDVDAWPETAQRAAAEEEHAWADALVTGSGVRGHSRRRLRAAAGHVTSFWTWHSLTVDQSLTDREAAGLAEALLMAAAGRGGRAPQAPASRQGQAPR